MNRLISWLLIIALWVGVTLTEKFDGPWGWICGGVSGLLSGIIIAQLSPRRSTSDRMTAETLNRGGEPE